MINRPVFEQIYYLARPYLNTRRNDIHIGISFNDQIVKDADKLFRYSQKGFEIDNKRFEETIAEGLTRLKKYLDRWFHIQTAYRIAKEELKEREKEVSQ